MDYNVQTVSITPYIKEVDASHCKEDKHRPSLRTFACNSYKAVVTGDSSSKTNFIVPFPLI